LWKGKFCYLCGKLRDMDFGALIQQVEKINQVFTDNAAKAINRNLTARKWLTGFYIVNYEQNGSDRAKYGEKTLQKMALLLSVEDPIARVFYELETIKGTWTSRELKRQIDTNYYIRSGISRNPEKMSRYVQCKINFFFQDFNANFAKTICPQ